MTDMIALGRIIPHFGGTSKSASAALDALRNPFANAEAVPDQAAALAEAEERGRRAGRAAADAEWSNRADAMQRQHEQGLEAARAAWVEGEGARLAAALDEGLSALETRISETTARSVLPFLEAPLREQAVRDLADTVTQILGAQAPSVLKIEGPQDLLDALGTRLGSRAAAVQFEVANLPDVRVTADATVIETQLRAWLDRLAAALS
ncbi:hypothetical protein [Amorphus sp. 3PC139-8]|uniref:hypothetical protein n=1 Tax=Amorphus sp. 3PC139-8 TaxID=2735676 RepID=UPI00345D1AFE